MVRIAELLHDIRGLGKAELDSVFLKSVQVLKGFLV
jgi:hypothetical protein